MKLSQVNLLVPFLLHVSLQDGDVKKDSKAIVLENSPKATSTRILTNDPAINGAVVGLGVGVIGSLLVGALLDNNNNCNNRGRRDAPTASTRFLPGLLGKDKCPPRRQPNSGYQTQNGYHNQNGGYQQPNNGYQQQNNFGYQQSNVGYHQPNVGYQQPIVGYHQPNNGYQQHNNGYQQSNNGYQQHNNGYQQSNNGYQQNNNGYQQSNIGYPHHNNGYKQQNNGYQQPNGYTPIYPTSGYNNFQSSQSPPAPHNTFSGRSAPKPKLASQKVHAPKAFVGGVTAPGSRAVTKSAVNFKN